MKVKDLHNMFVNSHLCYLNNKLELLYDVSLNNETDKYDNYDVIRIMPYTYDEQRRIIVMIIIDK